MFTQYDFTLRVTVDNEMLARHNETATKTGSGVQLPANPDEWDEDELRIAFNEQIAEAKVLDSSGPR